MTLLAGMWLVSNFHQIAPDSQAVVLRLGRIVRTQQAGLLLAWPRPIEEVRLLPGPQRQLSQEVAVLEPESDKARAVITSTGGAGTLPRGVSPYLTGDGNVVLLDATLIYRIEDPVGWTLSEGHVRAALDRLFRAATVRVTAGRNLNDFLVVASNDAAGSGGPGAVALRGEVRSALLETINVRLRELADSGASLGIEVERIDMTAWLPPQAKVAFDEVLTATQAADRGVAMARTDAERRRQEAAREKDRLLAAAQATAQEIVSTARVDTAQILALEHEETPQTRGSILLREYRAGVSSIMGHIGSATVIDPQSGVRSVLPGKTAK
jgi:regulator of protease activity HflC (stomatin/prohibitin superfamily)